MATSSSKPPPTESPSSHGAAPDAAKTESPSPAATQASSNPALRRRFEGKTVLVTGASRGLGRAMAVAFAEEGAYVVVGYHHHEKDAVTTLFRMIDVGSNGRAIGFDVRDKAAVDRAVEEVLRERGRVHVLVNNAGVARDVLFPLMDSESWDEVIATNLTGLYHCARAVVRPMISAGGGVIVNVGAVSAMRASPGQVNYAASKGGLVAFTRALGAEMAPRGIRVNAVIPGAIKAGLAAKLDHRVAERIRENIPVGRFGTAEEVARAVLFLASEDASYIVGQSLVVDGGLSA